MSPLGSDEIAGLGFEQVVRLEMSPEQRTEVRLTVADEGRWRGEVIAYTHVTTARWGRMRARSGRRGLRREDSSGRACGRCFRDAVDSGDLRALRRRLLMS